MANSLVGDRINALAPFDAFRLFSFSNNGMRKQAVLPEPVFAIATTSRPSRISGIVCVGCKTMKFNLSIRNTLYEPFSELESEFYILAV